MDASLKEIIKKDAFEKVTRLEAAGIQYPSVLFCTKQSFHRKLPRALTDVTSLQCMPSRSACERMKEICVKDKYTAISCESGTFTLQALSLLLKVHDLCDIKNAVNREQQWLAKALDVPNPACSYSEKHIETFRSKIFDSPEGSTVLESNSYILAADMATLAGNQWLHYGVMTGLAEILHQQNRMTGTLMLNDIVMFNDKELREYMINNIHPSMTYLSVFVHVGKNKNGDVFFSSPSQNGCHWAMVYIDLTVNKWFYCDSLAWDIPSTLKQVLSPIVQAVYAKTTITSKPFRGITQAHVHSTKVPNKCSKRCLANVPLQACGNICGVAVAIMGGIACKSPELWLNAFLNQKATLPSDLQWLTSPSSYSHFLRHTIISWLLTDFIDLSVMGIATEEGADPFDMVRGKMTRRFTGSVTIADDDENDGETAGPHIHQWQTVRRKERGSRKKINEASRAHTCKKGGKKTVSFNLEPEKHEEKRAKIEDVLIEPVCTTKKKEVEIDRYDDIEMPVIIDDGKEGINDERQNEEQVQGGTGSAKKGIHGEHEGPNEGSKRGDTKGIVEGNVKEEQVTTGGDGSGGNSEGTDDDKGGDKAPKHTNDSDIIPSKLEEEASVNGDNDGDTKSDCQDKGDTVAFYVGQLFASYDDLLQTKKSYEKKNYCEIINKKSKTLQSAKKNVPKRVANAKEALKYYTLHLCCKFGGKPQKLQDRKKNTMSFRQECPFEIYITLSEDGQTLKVLRLNEEHNHSLLRTLYEHLPRQRKVSNEIKADLEDSIKLKANKKLIQQKIQQTTGINITLKDISNMQQKVKNEKKKPNDLQHVIDYLRQQKGSKTELLVNEKEHFQGLFYQDQYMREMYDKFPEVLLVDATYKLLELRLPLYLLVVVDGDGLSEIVAMFILADETKPVIEASVLTFQKINPSWQRTKVIMADKDFTEREAFSKYFTEASLNICLYHALRSMRREVTCEKLGITSSERFRCLEILTKMAYSKSPQQYEDNVKMLDATRLNSVIDYLKENWIPIKEQWVSCFKDETFNLGETTNNRIESMFSKIKSVCTKYASLLQFFSEFFTVLKSLRNERNHHYLMSLARKPVQELEPNLIQFYKYLTPYAFEYVSKQIDLSKQIIRFTKKQGDTIEFNSNGNTNKATPSTCTCLFIKKMGLPCKHMFKVRTEFQMPLFDGITIAERWTRNYYESVQDIRFPVDDGGVIDNDEQQTVVTKTDPGKKRVLSQAQKFNKAAKIAQILASLASEGGMKTFNCRLQVLEEILALWQTGKEVSVSVYEDLKDDQYNVQTEIDRHLEAKCDGGIEVHKNECNGHSHDNVDEKHEKAHLDEEHDNEEMNKDQSWDDRKAGQHDGVKITDVSQNEKNEVEQEGTVDAEHICSDKDDVKQEQNHDDFKSIKMPPKIRKRGRPKGAEVTVIGLPRTKKRKSERTKMLPFKKLQPLDKEKAILDCLTNSKLAASEVLAGKRLLNDDDIEDNANLIPDTVRDNVNIDINRVEKYFQKEAWLSMVSVLQRKEDMTWQCKLCSKSIRANQNSISCDRCLLWFHFNCTSLNTKPKARNWFCKNCKSKYT